MATNRLTKIKLPDNSEYFLGDDISDVIKNTEKGAANGVAELDENGLVLSSQLPSYVDDVIEGVLVSEDVFYTTHFDDTDTDSNSDQPVNGESGKIYLDVTTNKSYRWSGSAFVEISSSLALGETSSTAYRGDRGKTAYNHSQTSGNPHGTTMSDIGISVLTQAQYDALSTSEKAGKLFFIKA